MRAHCPKDGLFMAYICRSPLVATMPLGLFRCRRGHAARLVLPWKLGV